MKFSWKYLVVVIGILAMVCVGLSSYVKELAPSRTLRVSFLDVGQGDAIYIRAPNGNDLIVDGGATNAVIQQLRHVMPLFDRDIDMMIATHPDKDHIGGLVHVFENYNVHAYVHTEVLSDASHDEQLAETAARKSGLDDTFARRGQRIILDQISGVYLDVLFPDQDTSNFKETNDASIIVQLVYGDHEFLLTGDAPIAIEQFLARADGARLASTVLKLGHHGSATSTSDEFLDAVAPSFAVVSAGKNNSYHHPAPSVIKRITARAIQTFSTINDGTITFVTDGKNILVQ